jgi:hypothetical protein
MTTAVRQHRETSLPLQVLGASDCRLRIMSSLQLSFSQTQQETDMKESLKEPLYPNVHIVNSTSYAATGTVVYAVCSDDDYSIDAGPGTSWTGPSRGGCLITKITAQLAVNGNFITATPYTSSGTSYSQFAILQTNNSPLEFEVTRRTNAVSRVSDDAKETEAAQ